VRLDVVTIFPDYFAPLSLSLVGKAIESRIVELAVHDLRDWTHDVHRTVDDTPFGGGAGMVMKPQPWGECLDDLLTGDLAGTRLVLPNPAGVPFRQALAQRWAGLDRLVFACGRYEGIDARVAQWAASRVEVAEVSLGDYVVGGGEVAALAMIEAVVRLLPGVLGNPESLVEESHSCQWGCLLEYPVYTKPSSWRGYDVPEILLSGHHGKVAEWRREQAETVTRQRRPDLLARDPDRPRGPDTTAGTTGPL
jgi:tRNA (guanine37-N1)-methyltransferase